MKVHEVDPNVDTHALLAGARFIDAYSIAIDDAALDAGVRPRKCWRGGRDGSRRCWPCATIW